MDNVLPSSREINLQEHAILHKVLSFYAVLGAAHGNSSVVRPDYSTRYFRPREVCRCTVVFGLRASERARERERERERGREKWGKLKKKERKKERRKTFRESVQKWMIKWNAVVRREPFRWVSTGNEIRNDEDRVKHRCFVIPSRGIITGSRSTNVNVYPRRDTVSTCR